ASRRASAPGRGPGSAHGWSCRDRAPRPAAAAGPGPWAGPSERRSAAAAAPWRAAAGPASRPPAPPPRSAAGTGWTGAGRPAAAIVAGSMAAAGAPAAAAAGPWGRAGDRRRRRGVQRHLADQRHRGAPLAVRTDRGQLAVGHGTEQLEGGRTGLAAVFVEGHAGILGERCRARRV